MSLKPINVKMIGLRSFICKGTSIFQAEDLINRKSPKKIIMEQNSVTTHLFSTYKQE